jgi:hypothetical protein
MTAVIAENRPHEFVSIRHVGMIEKGIEDNTSEKVRAWAPAYENDRFVDAPGGCRVVVTLDTAPDWEPYMLDTPPKALARLRALCEQQPATHNPSPFSEPQDRPATKESHHV